MQPALIVRRAPVRLRRQMCRYRRPLERDIPNDSAPGQAGTIEAPFLILSLERNQGCMPVRSTGGGLFCN